MQFFTPKALYNKAQGCDRKGAHPGIGSSRNAVNPEGVAQAAELVCECLWNHFTPPANGSVPKVRGSAATLGCGVQRLRRRSNV